MNLAMLFTSLMLDQMGISLKRLHVILWRVEEKLDLEQYNGNDVSHDRKYAIAFMNLAQSYNI